MRKEIWDILKVIIYSNFSPISKFLYAVLAVTLKGLLWINYTAVQTASPHFSFHILIWERCGGSRTPRILCRILDLGPGERESLKKLHAIMIFITTGVARYQNYHFKYSLYG